MKILKILILAVSILYTGSVSAQDTIGDKAACLAKLPIQITGSVSVQDLRDCMVSVWDDVENEEALHSRANVYNVKDAPYNAQGDFVTDDTAAIQAAIDAMVASGVKGAALYIPVGAYNISDTLTIRMDSFTDFMIFGDGPSSFIRWVGAGDALTHIKIDTEGVGCDPANEPTVVIPASDGGGTNATADYLIDTADAKTHFINITEPGTLYSSAPSITFTDTGGCSALPTATAYLYARKPMMRLIGGLRTKLVDFRLTAPQEPGVATGILLETNSSAVVTSRYKVERVQIEGNVMANGERCTIDKGFQNTAGAHVSLYYPELTGSGSDGNNDNHYYTQVEVNLYNVAAMSFENSQGIVNYIEQPEFDACSLAQTSTLTAMNADDDTDTSGALDQGNKGRGPYGLTSVLALGAPTRNGGAFFVNGGVWHRHMMDIYTVAKSENPIHVFGNLNSETGYRFMQVGSRTSEAEFCQPVVVEGATWTSSQAVDGDTDNAGFMTFSGECPVLIQGNFFRSTNTPTRRAMEIGVANDDMPIEVTNNFFRWNIVGDRGSVDQSPLVSIAGGTLTRAVRYGNAYANSNSNLGVTRPDEGNLGFGANDPTTLAAAATTVTLTNGGGVLTLTGDAGANTIATITGGVSGRTLDIICVDALVTITDTDAHTADTIDLAGTATNFVCADDSVLRIIYDGTSWYEISRSVN